MYGMRGTHQHTFFSIYLVIICKNKKVLSKLYSYNRAKQLVIMNATSTNGIRLKLMHI